MSAYDLNMRQDRKTGEYLAFVPDSYTAHNGTRYYMAYSFTDGWVEVSPEYATKVCKTVRDYPEYLKQAAGRSLGYIMGTTDRLRG